LRAGRELQDARGKKYREVRRAEKEKFWGRDGSEGREDNNKPKAFSRGDEEPETGSKEIIEQST